MPRIESVIVQNHFFDKVPLKLPEIKGIPTRTLEQVLRQDWTQTLIKIGKIYVPSFSDEKNTWVHTLGWWELLLQGLDEQSESARKFPIAFATQTKNWENDIRLATLTSFERFKIGCYEANAQLFSNYPRHLQTTDAIRLTTEFFWSGGVKYREEASDFLIGYLSFLYWARLKNRVHFPFP